MFEKIKQLMTGNLSKAAAVYIDDRVMATVFVIGSAYSLTGCHDDRAKHRPKCHHL